VKAVIEPKSQADVLRNRRIILEHIRGLAEAAKQIAAEEKVSGQKKPYPLQMKLPFHYFEMQEWLANHTKTRKETKE
jgi:hypothetical protein